MRHIITEEFLRRELDSCREKIDRLLPRFQDCFPAANTEGLVYPAEYENFEWTTSFLSGMLWLLYEHTGDPDYLPVLRKHLDSFFHRVEDPGYLDTHDLGFLYSLSCYPAVLLRKDPRAEECFLKAAQALRRRYFPQAGIIQAWGDLEDPNNRGRMIIDCLLNLPLLYQAARLTGDRTYWEMAYSHAKQARKYLVRPDSTTYHTYYMDVDTGAPRFGRTAQGYSDSSCWARGQAWGVYGFALSFRHTGDRSFLDTTCKLLDYYLERLPEDGGIAERYRQPGAAGTVGLIRPLSRCFCAQCNRIRLTADGRLKPCLHSREEIPVRGLHGEALRQQIERAIRHKPERHGALSAQLRSEAGRAMHQIGG